MKKSEALTLILFREEIRPLKGQPYSDKVADEALRLISKYQHDLIDFGHSPQDALQLLQTVYVET